MGPLRAALRLVALAAVTAPLYAGFLLCKPLHLVSRSLGGRLHDFWVGTWARSCAAILGIRVEVAGSPPEPPYFLVSNHLSYLDILVFHGQLGSAHLLSKSEVAGWPVLGLLARSAGTLFIDRRRRRDLPRVIDEVRRRLDAGRGVVVFPEGTSSQGAEVGPFKPALFEVAIETGMPVSCAAISYQTPPQSAPAHLAVCWWGDMPFLGHLLPLMALPGVRASLRFAEQPVTAPDRKSLASLAQRAVAAEFTPVVTTQVGVEQSACAR